MHPIYGVSDNLMFKQRQRQPRARSGAHVCVCLCYHERVYLPLVNAGAAIRQTDRCQNTVIAVMTERGIKSHQIYFHAFPKGEN